MYQVLSNVRNEDGRIFSVVAILKNSTDREWLSIVADGKIAPLFSAGDGRVFLSSKRDMISAQSTFTVVECMFTGAITTVESRNSGLLPTSPEFVDIGVRISNNVSSSELYTIRLEDDNRLYSLIDAVILNENLGARSIDRLYAIFASVRRGYNCYVFYSEAVDQVVCCAGRNISRASTVMRPEAEFFFPTFRVYEYPTELPNDDRGGIERWFKQQINTTLELVGDRMTRMTS